MSENLFGKLDKRYGPGSNQAKQTLMSLTPLEIDAELNRYGSKLVQALKVWRSSDIVHVLSREEPELFERTEYALGVQLFTEKSIRANKKSLIIAFSGRANRLMIPPSLFLQHIPSNQFDVVMLWDSRRAHYLTGIDGYAQDSIDLTFRLARTIDLDRYQSIYCYGTSMGGFAALRAGMLLNADRAISIGGRFPWHINRLLDSSTKPIPAFDPLCACMMHHDCELICFYSAQQRGDVDDVARLAQFCAVSRRPLTGFSSHNVIYPIWQSGTLRDFFGSIFDFVPRTTKPRKPVQWWSPRQL